jgi:hypothetical protein
MEMISHMHRAYARVELIYCPSSVDVVLKPQVFYACGFLILVGLPADSGEVKEVNKCSFWEGLNIKR